MLAAPAAVPRHTPHLDMHAPCIPGNSSTREMSAALPACCAVTDVSKQTTCTHSISHPSNQDRVPEVFASPPASGGKKKKKAAEEEGEEAEEAEEEEEEEEAPKVGQGGWLRWGAGRGEEGRGSGCKEEGQAEEEEPPKVGQGGCRLAHR